MLFKIAEINITFAMNDSLFFWRQLHIVTIHKCQIMIWIVHYLHFLPFKKDIFHRQHF